MIRPPLDVSAASRVSTHARLRDVGFVELKAAFSNSGPEGSSLSWDLVEPIAIYTLSGDELDPNQAIAEAPSRGANGRERARGDRAHR